MKVLVIGGGGREHALVWKIAQSELVDKVYCAPGNPGIGQLAECLDIPATDIFGLRDFAYRNKIDLTVVGPEAPLVEGIVECFRKDKMRIFGPTKKAAELEGSKSFCKDLLLKHGIPTAEYRTFQNPGEACQYLQQVSFPAVIKADGLAAGKGVIICQNLESAEATVKDIMENKVFGDAGEKVIVEEYLTGEEVSVLSITDGQTILVLEPAQDHKRALDNDAGPNTGGMGAYSPPPFLTPELMSRVIKEILVPTVHAMKSVERPYQGVLYAGLILTATGPKVLEYNVRFGDPETQPILMRLKSDLVPLMLGATEGSLDKCEPPEWLPQSAICVVIASGGYPGKYPKGLPINGLTEAGKIPDVQIFHAGTALKNDQIVTAGGRVLGVTGLGEDIAQAREKTYNAIKQISFDGCFCRSDIGLKALRQ